MPKPLNKCCLCLSVSQLMMHACGDRVDVGCREPAPQDGILESYWGEHIHLGYYDEEERKKVRRGEAVVARAAPEKVLPSAAGVRHRFVGWVGGRGRTSNRGQKCKFVSLCVQWLSGPVWGARRSIAVDGRPCLIFFGHTSSYCLCLRPSPVEPRVLWNKLKRDLCSKYPTSRRY